MSCVGLALLVAIIVAACGGDATENSAARLAELTLAELASRPRELDLAAAPTLTAPPSVYGGLAAAVARGDMTDADADRALLSLLFGDGSAVPDAVRPAGAAADVPDMELFWLLGRLQGYPPALRAELEAMLPANRSRAVADVPRWWNPLASTPAYAAPPVAAPAAAAALADDCVSRVDDREFVQLGESSTPGPDGQPVYMSLCGLEGTPDAEATLGDAVATLSDIMTFFGSSGRKLFPDRRGATMPTQTRIFLVPTSDVASHGGMGSCREIIVATEGKQACEIAATLRHEIFHCVHMKSLGYGTDLVPEGFDPEQPLPGAWSGKTPTWVTEGSAAWAEERFGPANNDEWRWYLPAAAYPFRSLEDRSYDAALFFLWVAQQGGGDDAVKRIVAAYDAGAGAAVGGADVGGTDLLSGLLEWPRVWLDFADSASGWTPMFEVAGRPELADTPAFPYDPVATCGGVEVAVAQNHWARVTSIGDGAGTALHVDVEHVGAQYETLDVQVTAATQFIDVGFTAGLADRIAEGNDVRVLAVLRTMDGDHVVDWTDSWRNAPAELGPLQVPESWEIEDADRRFRVCLTDEAEGCYERPEQEIYRFLDEIDLVIANAGTVSADAIHGSIVMVPGSLPGWAARRVAAGALPASPASVAAGQDVTGSVRMNVDPDEPLLSLVADWAWFPRDEYPWSSIGEENPRVRVHPSLLTAYVNNGCHFEGFVTWRYEERGVEVQDDGWVVRSLHLTREDQGGFFNNELRFKCELLTRNRRVNQLIGTLVTMGEAPTAGFQSALVQGAYMRAISEINNAERTPGSFGDLLYETFKSILTADLMDADEADIDLFVSPDGRQIQYAITRGRSVVFGDTQE